MSKVKIIIVEDDSAQMETWKRQLDRHNALNGADYSADYAVSYEQASQLVESNKYDAAIVDIRLQSPSGGKDATTEGNDVRDLLLNSEVVLIAHVTGEPDAVDFSTSNYRDLVKVFVKGDSGDDDLSLHEQVLGWLEAKSVIISTMKKVKSNIAEKMAGLFYSSIWPRWDSWQIVENDAEDFVSLSITRHITSHLYSTFLTDSEGKVHPEEWYFQPPSIERFHTGDLLKDGEDYYILITPRCDLERLSDGQNLLFAKMEIAESWSADKEQLDEIVRTKTEELEGAKDDKQRDKINGKISSAYSVFRQKYYGHKRNSSNYHFLPEVNISQEEVHGPFYVDFTNLHSVKVGTIKEHEMKDSKIAALSTEFLPAFVQRLGVYMSRIGSPDYSHITE